jgi:HlyD family secretion protein
VAEKKKINWLKISAAFLVLVFVLLGGRTVYLKKNTIDYYRLKPLDINRAVLASGRVSFPQPYEITAATSGKISAVNCREGELVQEDQLLIEMDDYQDRQNMQLALSDLNLSRSKKRNIEEEALPKQEEQVRQDKVKLLEAEKEMNRLKTLHEQGAVPVVDFEKAVNNYQLFLSQYNQAVLTRDSLAGGSSLAEIEAQISYNEAQLKIAQKVVGDKKIIAPVTGTVSKVNYSTGQQVTTGEVLITVLRQQNWVVEADVDQKELSQIKPGQPALVALDAYPQDKLEAELFYIAPQIDEKKGTCLLRLEIKNAKPFIRYGMAASVELLSETNRQVNALPKQFVDFTEKEAFVWILKDDQAVKTPIAYRSVGERWVIAEDLPEGTVVLSPAKKPGGFKVHLGREVLPDAI